MGGGYMVLEMFESRAFCLQNIHRFSAILSPMPLQNRVTPYGDLVAVPERGTMLGNRGILHDANKQIVRTAQVRRWLICVLEFKGIRRSIMAPHHYTELFFLDEATALAAGHRPCWECRNQAYCQFQAAWREAFGVTPSAEYMDRQLQSDRRQHGRQKTHEAKLGDVPTGSFIERDGHAWLRHGDTLHRWTPGGYTDNTTASMNEVVTVLTPRSTVRVLQAGYVPLIHHSIGS